MDGPVMPSRIKELRMLISRYTLAFLPLLMSGCAAVGSGQFPAVSERDTQALIESISHTTAEQTQAFEADAAYRLENPDYAYIEWVQPENKSEPCKIRMGQKKDKDTIWWREPASQGTLYWDGDCRDGYAYGIGRNFVTMPDGSLRSTLVTYPGGNQPPQTHLDVNYTNDTIIWVSSDHEKQALLALSFQQRTPTIKPLVWSRYLMSSSENIMYILNQ